MKEYVYLLVVYTFFGLKVKRVELVPSELRAPEDFLN